MKPVKKTSTLVNHQVSIFLLGIFKVISTKCSLKYSRIEGGFYLTKKGLCQCSKIT